MTASARSLSFEEFRHLGTAWDEMVLASETPLPFLCHAWLRSWWRHLGAGQDFVAVVAGERDRLLGGVPLAIRTVRVAGLAVRIAEICGTGPVPTRGMGLADKADVVVRTDAGEARELLCKALAGLLDEADVLALRGLDDASPSRATLAGALPRPGAVRARPRSVSPFLVLPPTWEGYLRSRSGNFRKHLRKYGRNLDHAGRVSIERLAPGDDCAAWMSDVLEVNDASWKAARGTNLARHPAIRSFLVELASEMAQEGRLDLHRLRLDGATVAYELCFDFGGRVSSYNGAYRRGFGKLSPGTVLTSVVIREAIERGRREYDLLRGDEEYKTRWSDSFRTELELFAPAGRLRGRLGALGLRAKAALRSRPWLRELADRASGSWNRLRHRT